VIGNLIIQKISSNDKLKKNLSYGIVSLKYSRISSFSQVLFVYDKYRNLCVSDNFFNDFFSDTFPRRKHSASFFPSEPTKITSMALIAHASFSEPSVAIRIFCKDFSIPFLPHLPRFKLIL
jgi:hypothetical protein